LLPVYVEGRELMAYRIEDDDAYLIRQRDMSYNKLRQAALHVWHKAMLTIHDDTDDDAAAALAKALNVPYTRKFKQ
jgi:hypothetical protein